jgi:hypothetical protein
MQIVATAGTVTGFRCYTQTAPGAGNTLTFTLRKGTTPANGAATTWTCAVTGTATSGTGTNSGGPVTFSAGDLLDIGLSGQNVNKPVSAAIAYGP